MPTGYTHKIADGQSFEDFALGCARAFGACIMQRDDPADEKPKLQESSNYHTQKLLQAKEQLSEFLAMTEAEKLDYGHMCAEEDIFRINERIEKNIALSDKYTAMYMKVLDWVPPSSEHVELKKFMINQLEESKDFDCNNDYNYRELEEAKKASAMDYYNKMLDTINWDISYHSEQAQKETERTNGRNQWVQDLYASLNISL